MLVKLPLLPSSLPSIHDVIFDVPGAGLSALLSSLPLQNLVSRTELGQNNLTASNRLSDKIVYDWYDTPYLSKLSFPQRCGEIQPGPVDGPDWVHGELVLCLDVGHTAAGVLRPEKRGCFSLIILEFNRAPFDLTEAESELVSGFNTEFGATGFVLLFLAEYMRILVGTQLLAIFCVGVMGITPFLFVGMFFCWVVLISRAAYPRVKLDIVIDSC